MTLRSLTDVAVIILVLEGLVVALVPLALSILAVRGMRWLLPRMRLWLRTAYEWLYMAGVAIRTLMRWLLAPILYLSGLRAGVRAGAAAWRRR